MRNNFAANGLMVLFMSLLASCASQSPTSRFGSEPNIDSRAIGAAYAAEGFTYSKNMPLHQKSPFDFYFRTCTHDDGKAYYSKTSYDCTMIP